MDTLIFQIDSLPEQKHRMSLDHGVPGQHFPPTRVYLVGRHLDRRRRHESRGRVLMWKTFLRYL